jgi:hypothetical protein
MPSLVVKTTTTTLAARRPVPCKFSEGAQARAYQYELGELLPAVLTRSKELYGKAAEAAQSWGNETTKAAIAERKAALAQTSQASNVEQWAVNPAVHFNAWANFGTNDFIPVVSAFKDLLGALRCADCGSWLYVTPRSLPDALRCQCAATNFNLKSKLK